MNDSELVGVCKRRLVETIQMQAGDLESRLLVTMGGCRTQVRREVPDG